MDAAESFKERARFCGPHRGKMHFYAIVRGLIVRLYNSRLISAGGDGREHATQCQFAFGEI